jgi:hypothetical protein
MNDSRGNSIRVGDWVASSSGRTVNYPLRVVAIGQNEAYTDGDGIHHAAEEFARLAGLDEVRFAGELVRLPGPGCRFDGRMQTIEPIPTQESCP